MLHVKRISYVTKHKKGQFANFTEDLAPAE